MVNGHRFPNVKDVGQFIPAVPPDDLPEAMAEIANAIETANGKLTGRESPEIIAIVDSLLILPDEELKQRLQELKQQDLTLHARVYARILRTRRSKSAAKSKLLEVQPPATLGDQEESAEAVVQKMQGPRSRIDEIRSKGPNDKDPQSFVFPPPADSAAAVAADDATEDDRRRNRMPPPPRKPRQRPAPISGDINER